MRMKASRIALMLLLAGTAVGCQGGAEDDEFANSAPKEKPAAEVAAEEAKLKAAAAVAVENATRVFKDTDFAESEQNRDPFRSFLTDPRAKGAMVAQRTVLMPNTPIDGMRLIAIITGIDQPRAMIVDEQGVGYVTTRGDFVGRADVVQSGSAENLPVTLNWRVDRIRENEVVLAREDPSGPNRPPLTRVIPLHEEEEEANPEITTARKGDQG